MTTNVLGKDIKLKDNDIQFSPFQDFLTITDVNNLRQAIVNRLKTIVGEYFNSNYGSELKNVIGKPRNELTRGRIIGYVSEALNQEPRIQRIDDILVTFPEENIYQVNVEITVVPIEDTTPLNLVFPLFIN